MTAIPLGYSSFVRAVTEEAPIVLENRYFEQNPANLNEQASLISRPGFRKWLTISGNPIDNIYFQPGSFNDSLFVTSGGSLYRVDKNETVVSIATGIFNTSFGSSGRVTTRMAATASIGGTPEYLWIADGKYLWLYANSNSATGTLTASSIASGNKLHVGASYYQFTSASVNAGTPAGTFGSPWLVAVGGSVTASMNNLRNAINETGVAGTDYSSAVTPNAVATAFNNNSAVMKLYSKALDSTGNSVVTGVDAGAGLSFSGANLVNGGTAGVSQVLVPDDLGVIDVAFISGYIIFVIGEGYGVNGRFYWVEPGTVVPDALNFATAERTADPLYGVKTIEDQFWLFGTSTTEIWYPTGDPQTPFQRLEGKLFNRGIWPGSEIKIKDQIILIDTDGIVYSVQSGPKRISDNSIEEQIRKSFSSQVLNNTVLRTWAFSLDGHDFYLLYLPGQATYVYDLSTEMWSVWKSNGASYLNQMTGLNWTSAGSVTFGHTQETNVVAGDLRSGILWLADPDIGYDQNITTAAVEPFTSKATGGVAIRGRNATPCTAVFLSIANGAPKVTGAGFKLRTSDDKGHTWIDHGTIAVTPGDYGQELSWRSLGMMAAPGRLFEVSDSGGAIRVDGLDM